MDDHPIAFGVVVVAWPEASLAAMAVGFAVYALVDGLVSFAGLLGPGRSWTLVAQGIVGIAVGVLARGRADRGRRPAGRAVTPVPPQRRRAAASLKDTGSWYVPPVR